MEKHAVLIVGRGKLAQELLDGLRSQTVSMVAPWEDRDAVRGQRVFVVHAGSGRELGDAVKFCSVTGSVLLDLSTAGSQLPEAPDFPLVVCPNVNMQMLGFMAMVRQGAKYFRGRDIRITESHQASKSTRPGTAIHLAHSLDVPEEEIRSERDPKTQSEVLKIPSAYITRHAFHEIVISDAEVEIRLQTRVLGKTAYASGLARIIDMMNGTTIGPGLHDIVDLLVNDFGAPVDEPASNSGHRKNPIILYKYKKGVL